MEKHDAVLITTRIEHKSILSFAEDDKFSSRIIYVDVDKKGKVDLEQLDQLCSALYENDLKILVSIQGANSEIGTIQSIKEISKIVHRYGGVFHTDATQLLSNQKMNMKENGIDMMSMSGQKIHAPKGIGLLYVKNGITLSPLIYGSQMNGLRGGTENVPYIAGLHVAFYKLEEDYKKSNDVKRIRDLMKSLIIKHIKNVRFNGAEFDRLTNNINISFKGINSESLLLLLDMNGICVSSGSACNSNSTDVSTTLKEIGVPDEYIYGTIRITISDDIKENDVYEIVDTIKKNVNTLREVSIDKEYNKTNGN